MQQLPWNQQSSAQGSGQTPGQQQMQVAQPGSSPNQLQQMMNQAGQPNQFMMNNNMMNMQGQNMNFNMNQSFLNFPGMPPGMNMQFPPQNSSRGQNQSMNMVGYPQQMNNFNGMGNIMMSGMPGANNQMLFNNQNLNQQMNQMLSLQPQGNKGGNS